MSQLRDGGSRVSFPAGARYIYLFWDAQTGCGLLCNIYLGSGELKLACEEARKGPSKRGHRVWGWCLCYDTGCRWIIPVPNTSTARTFGDGTVKICGSTAWMVRDRIPVGARISSPRSPPSLLIQSRHSRG